MFSCVFGTHTATRIRNLNLFTALKARAKKCFEIYTFWLSFFFYNKMDFLVVNTIHQKLPRATTIISRFHQPLGRDNDTSWTAQAQCTLHLTYVYRKPSVWSTCFDPAALSVTQSSLFAAKLSKMMNKDKFWLTHINFIVRFGRQTYFPSCR